VLAIDGQDLGAAGGRLARRGRSALVLAAALAALCAVLAGTALAASTNFVEPVSSPEAAGGAPQWFAAADLNGDGDRDLAVANVDSDNVTILFNLPELGPANFAEPIWSPEPVGDAAFSVVAADFDGDGDQDLAVANEFSDNVTILRNNGAGNFAQPATSPEAGGDEPTGLVASDLDGDGDQDLAVASFLSNAVTILRNTGAGNFVQPATSPEATGSVPREVVAADLDGDADPDLAVPNSFGASVTILKNNGAGDFVQPPTSPEAAGSGSRSVAAADFDGDGDRDLAVANAGSDDVTILRNNGAGNFVQPATSPEAAGDGPFSVAAADLDGDADPDLAVANSFSDNVTILRNR